MTVDCEDVSLVKSELEESILKEEVFEIEVSDLSGKVVARMQSVGSALQVDGLENGMYIVRLYSQQQSYIQKVVVTQ